MDTKRIFTIFLTFSITLLAAGSYFFSSPRPEEAQAAAKTKTIVWFVGSNASTTAVASAATTTFAFTMNIPDIVPTTQPIRSAYILYNMHWNNTTAISASTFTLFKAGGAAQAITAPTSVNNSGEEEQFALRLDVTGALRTIIGNASGTYTMNFTANFTGPTRIGEGAELYVTYDYDPFAATQVNTVYNWVYSTSTQLGTTVFTSPTFNFNLPESGATTTALSGSSSTNHFWVEYRGRVSGNSLSADIGWNAETTSSATFTQAADSFSFLLLMQPKTTSTSPSSGNTFKMKSSVATGISNPNAIAIATYTYNFAASTKLRKTLQVLLMQSNVTTSSTSINTTSTIVIPETSPSSTSAFLFGRESISTSSNPGINANLGAPGCSFPATTAITEAAQSTDTTGFPVIVWDVGANLSFNTNGTKTVCSVFSNSAVANIAGLMLYWSYDYTNVTTAGARYNQNAWFLAASNTTAGTNFSTTFSAVVIDSSTTMQLSWLNAEYDDNGTGNAVVSQRLTLGTGGSTNAFSFTATGENTFGEVFSTSTASGLTTGISVTINCIASCINDAAYGAWWQTDINPASLQQAHYHWRNNDGSESAATASANEDTATTTIQGSVYRLRFEVANTGDATTSPALRLEYQKNATSGAWSQVATSTLGSAAWQMATSSFVTDGTSTTNIATTTGGTTDDGNIFFLGGEVVATTSRNQTATTTITGTQFTEMEFAITPTVNATPNAAYYLRLTNASTLLDVYSVYASTTVLGSAPVVSAVSVNNGNPINLTVNATTSVNINFTVTDNNGCSDVFSNGNVTSTAFRSSLGSVCSANNLNCYIVSTTTNNCTSGTSANATATVGIYYFAQATDSSSSFSSDTWQAAVIVRDSTNATSTATSTGVELNTLLGLNVTPTTISYGTVGPGSDTGSSNQTCTIQNAGNASTTLQVSGTALTSGGNSLATSSQRYATSSFTFGGLEQVLSGTATAVSGFLLTSPTSTTAVQSNTFWGVQVASGNPVGTYSGTNTFTATFSP